MSLIEPASCAKFTIHVPRWVFQAGWSALDGAYKGGIQLRESLLLNVAGMPVAGAMTYPALLRGVPSTWIAVGDQ